MSDVHELMRRDPLKLTKADVSQIVQVMRENRGRFTAGNAKAGSTKPLTEKQKQLGGLAETLGLKISL